MQLSGDLAGIDPNSIPAKRAKQRSNLFTHGELGRLILDCLRKAREPLPTAAIVAYVAEAIGQGEAGRKVVYKTVATNLRYMAARHRTITKIGEREAARWVLA